MRPVNAKLGFFGNQKSHQNGIFFLHFLSWLPHLKTVKNTGDLLGSKRIRLEASNTIKSNLNEFSICPIRFQGFAAIDWVLPKQWLTLLKLC